jgi:hypothetical protein
MVRRLATVDEDGILRPAAKFDQSIVRPAGGTRTPGSVIKIGTEAAMPANIGTAMIVGGGAPNYENVIGGITVNVNTANSNVPLEGAGEGAGALVDPDGNWNSILGGYDNVVNGWANQVQSYHSKVEAGANHGTIAGGSIHTIGTNVGYATIGGGTGHSVTGNYATVAGGTTNNASGLNTTIGGGLNHTATQRSAVVAGGESNDATATYATVGGGLSNDATGSAATVAGGQTNVASGASSFVAGRENTASSEWTVATGRNASASVPGERAHAADFFAVKGDAQHRTFVLRKQTTDATVTELFANSAGSARMLVPADSTWTFSALVTARRTDADNESAGYKIEGVLDRNATANTIAFVGTPTVTVLGEDVAGWDCAVGVETTVGALIIRVTGEAAKTIRWVAVVDAVQVTG